MVKASWLDIDYHVQSSGLSYTGDVEFAAGAAGAESSGVRVNQTARDT